MRYALIVSALVLMSAPALARENFSSWRCEDPDVISFITERVKKVRFEKNQSLTSIGISVKGITKSVTRSVSRDRIVCDITLKLSGRNAKNRARFIYSLQNGSGDQVFESLK